MYPGLLHTHSFLRYMILLGLIVVIVKALLGLINKKPYSRLDDKLGLATFIFTHTQLLIGVILYFVSPLVQFGSTTMADKTTRYWTVEHLTGMLIAVILITVARITSKKMTAPADKHKRMLIFNLTALVIIVVVISMSGRKVIG
jgi:uncharacterized membrane protein